MASPVHDSPPVYDEKDSEKNASHSDYVVQADDKFHLDAHDLDRVQRRLKQRHVQMIAVCHIFLFSSRGGIQADCHIDRWYHRYWSLPRFRVCFAWRRSSWCAHCLCPRRHRRLLGTLRHRRDDIPCAYFWHIPSLCCPLGRPCPWFRTRVSQHFMPDDVQLLIRFYATSDGITSTPTLSPYLSKSLLQRFCSLSGMPTSVSISFVVYCTPAHFKSCLAGSSSWIHCGHLCPGLRHQYLRCPVVRRVRVLLLHHQTYVYNDITLVNHLLKPFASSDTYHWTDLVRPHH